MRSSDAPKRPFHITLAVVLILAAVAGTAGFAPAHVSHREKAQLRSLHLSSQFSSSLSFSSDAVLSSFDKIAERDLDATISAAASNPDRLTESLSDAGETVARLFSQLLPNENIQLRRPYKLSRTVEYC